MGPVEGVPQHVSWINALLALNSAFPSGTITKDLPTDFHCFKEEKDALKFGNASYHGQL